MKFIPKLLPLLFLMVFFACDPSGSTATNNGGNTDTTTTPNSSGKNPQQTVPVNKKPDLSDLEKVGQTMSTSKFNEDCAAAREGGESWAGSPITIALRFAGEDFDSRKKSIDVESLSGGEVFNKVLVSITEDGFLDDSIRGSMVILRMEENNGFWEINSAKKVWRCWENRGHVAYNSEPCH